MRQIPIFKYFLYGYYYQNNHYWNGFGFNHSRKVCIKLLSLIGKMEYSFTKAMKKWRNAASILPKFIAFGDISAGFCDFYSSALASKKIVP